MTILGIETSCDETAAAVLQKSGNRITILSNVVASSADLQAKYGGVIPEQAAREQIKSIIPVIEEALKQAFPKSRLPRSAPGRPRNDVVGIDALAVTYGPGLIGPLLVGVETAKVLAKVWDKPLIPVNHLLGHFYANWIFPSSLREDVPERYIPKQSSTSNNQIATSSVSRRTPRNDEFQPPFFPCIGLLVSGGHTDLVLFTDHGKYKYLGGTRDDAAGECFDKCARLLGLPYPGGPEISKLASLGDASRFKLPRPMIDSKDFDFSFSGLKTSVSNIVYGISEKQNNKRLTINDKQNLAASIEAAIVDVLVAKTITAAKQYKVKQIIVAGGVAANQKLTSDLKLKVKSEKLKVKIFIPPAYLCTDNAAMIAAAALFNYQPTDPLSTQVDSGLTL